jgi:hypothetical protein
MAKLPPITHEKVQVVMTIENGKVIDTRKVRDNELIATMDTFSGWLRKLDIRFAPEWRMPWH